jgi:hypothetical protein
LGKTIIQLWIREDAIRRKPVANRKKRLDDSPPDIAWSSA